MGIKYSIKEKLFAVGGKFNVYDEEGKEAYLVQADKFDIGKNISVYNADRSRKLLYIKQVIKIGPHQYIMYDENGIEIATIKKEFMVRNYNITSVFGNMELTADGILGRNYEIYKQGIKLGEMSKEWTWGRDRYVLDVMDPKFTLMMIGLLIIIDMVSYHEK